MFRALIIVVMAVAAAAFSCEECRAAGYNFRLAYEPDGIVVECVPEDDASCASEDRGANVVRCHKDCAILEQMDARLLVEGKFVYPEGSCFVQARDECLDATTDCEVVPETVSGEDGFGCVPRGFLAQAALREGHDPTPRGCYVQETCGQCLNQKEEHCVWCALDSAGKEGRCGTKCQNDPPFWEFKFTERDKCPQLQCKQCTGSDNIWRLSFGRKGVSSSCVNEVTPRCRDEDHVVQQANVVRCYNHEWCSEVEKIRPILLGEGFHPHPADSCWLRDDCTKCLDGTGKCEYWSEGTSQGCAPKGFLRPGPTLTPVNQCSDTEKSPV